ncbi:MAG: putative porin [Bacteroidota bacterium]
MRLALIILAVIGFSEIALGQILDDSTKLVYGPETTLFIYESDLLNNTGTFRPIDTALVGHHRFGYVAEQDFKYQNLGNIGTAVNPIYAPFNKKIGAYSGFHAYDYLFRDASVIRYFNTRSPFLGLDLNFGGNGRSIINVEFSRNVKPNWNVGFDLSLYRIDKQIGEEQTRGDRNAESNQFSFFTGYHTKDSVYQLLASFSTMNHDVIESGGVVVPDTADFEDFFDEDNDINLRNAVSGDDRTQYNLYQQYTYSDYVQFYHLLDFTVQENSFVDSRLDIEGDFFAPPLIDEDTTRDITSLRSLSNEIGIKGNLPRLFYRFYYKRRELKLIYEFLPSVGPQTENYGGGKIRYEFSPKVSTDFEGEFLQGGFYSLEATFRYKTAQIQAGANKITPSFLVQRYFGNHDEWDNNFTGPEQQFISAEVGIPIGEDVKITPFAKYQDITNPIFFDLEANPEQSVNSAAITTTGLKLSANFLKNVYFTGEANYTSVSGSASEVYPIPELFYVGTLSYRNLLFKKRLDFEIGVDTHWKSDYFALDYDPVIQQFFLQERFEIPAYLLVDLFINFKVNRTRFTFKIKQISQGLIDPGYLVTPSYIGTPSTFDLLITWPFFD